MKAAIIDRFGPPEVFRIADVPEPEIKADELLIRVIAGSVNPIDFKQRKGNHRFIFGSDFPVILGYDVMGEVVKTGSETDLFKAGDMVCGVLSNKYGGGLGEYAKGTEKCFAKIPDGKDSHQYAALPLTGLTALQALRDKGSLCKNKSVLIIGAAGGVGHFAIQIASLLGAEITATTGEKHFDFINGLVNATLINYTKTNILTSDQKYHLIFDTVGKYSFPKLRHMLLPGGIYINTLPRPKILVHKIISLFTKGKKAKTLLMKHNSTDLKLLVDWVKKGRIRICIDKEFRLEEIAQAHRYIEKGHTQGKILIRYT
ncbi:MAG: NAD(P)-dependent alcohol dehydrogenase [Bacteroidales bacterium]